MVLFGGVGGWIDSYAINETTPHGKTVATFFSSPAGAVGAFVDNSHAFPPDDDEEAFPTLRETVPDPRRHGLRDIYIPLHAILTGVCGVVFGVLRYVSKAVHDRTRQTAV